MKKANVMKIAVVLGLSAILGGISGCNHRERVTAYEVTEAGEGWVESTAVEQHRGPHGKVVTEKESVFEGIRCVDRSGRQIKARTPQACRKAGGQVVKETVIQQEVTNNKHRH